MSRNLLLVGLCAVLLTAVFFAVAFWGPSLIHVNPQAPTSLKDESLTFVREVVGFDKTNYEVVDYYFAPQLDVASSNGLPLYLMQYDLKSSDDQANVDIFYTKANVTYTQEPYFNVYSGTLFSPAYPTDKVLNWTKSFLERYQNFRNNASYVFRDEEKFGQR